eukprot:2473318-Ditylum_brightwellii.AAC.1
MQELGYVVCLAEAEEAVIGVGPLGRNGVRAGWQRERVHGWCAAGNAVGGGLWWSCGLWGDAP